MEKIGQIILSQILNLCKGPFKYDISALGRLRVSQILIFADKGGRGGLSNTDLLV